MKLKLTIVAIGVAVSSAAIAQDAAIVEGPGYQVSEGTVLHPSVGVETGVVSNVFYEDVEPNVSGLLRLTGDFSIASRPPERLSAGDGDESSVGTPPKLHFRLGGMLRYEEYLSPDEVTRAQRDLAIGLHLNLVGFPEGTVQYLLEDRFVRDVRPRNFESRGKLTRDINQLKGQIRYQPGGRALSAAARYENRIDVFESDQSQFANRIQHTLGVRVDWRWLPITLLYFDGSLGFFGGLGSEAQSFKQSSNPLRLKLGVNTALAEFITIRAYGGFGKGFYAAGGDFTGPLVGAEVGYRYSPIGRVTAGYEYGFEDSINANFYREHKAHLGLDQQLDRLLLKATLAAHLRTYVGVPMSISPVAERADVIVDLLTQAQYILLDRLAFTASYDLVLDSTDFTYMVDGVIVDPSFVRHQLLVGARVAF